MSLLGLSPELIGMIAIEILHTAIDAYPTSAYYTGKNAWIVDGYDLPDEENFPSLQAFMLTHPYLHSASQHFFTRHLTSSREVDSLLLFAAYAKDHELVHRALSLNACTSICDMSCRTALHHACQGGDITLVRILLPHSMSCINADSPNGGTPLDSAALADSWEIVSLLLEHGAETAYEDLDDALITSVRCSKPCGIRLYAQLGADTTQCLSMADSVGVETVQQLLDLGADANGGLDAAASAGDTEILDLLISSGADLLSSTALYTAVSNGRTMMVAHILSLGVVNVNHTRCPTLADNIVTAAFTLTKVAASQDLLALLLGAGASPTRPNSSGATPLSAAVQHPLTGHMVIKFLLRAPGVSCTVNTLMSIWHAPPLLLYLNSTILRNQIALDLKIISLLLAHGASATLPNPAGATSFAAALRHPHATPSLIRLLLRRSPGAVHTLNTLVYGETALMVHAGHANPGNPGIVDVLVRYGADVNAISGRGETVLRMKVRHVLECRDEEAWVRGFSVLKRLVALGAVLGGRVWPREREMVVEATREVRWGCGDAGPREWSRGAKRAG